MGNKNCEFYGPWGLGGGAKIPKIDQFSKIFFSTTTHVEEKLNAW
jgi:hypothetical protein